MPSTTVGLVYSSATGRIRQIIIPSDDSQLNSFALGQGQSLHIISDSSYAGQSLNQLQAILNGFTGKTPANDRYANVDQGGNVVSVHIADPLCGDVSLQPGNSLVASATANQGNLFINGTPIVLNQQQQLSFSFFRYLPPLRGRQNIVPTL